MNSMEWTVMPVFFAAVFLVVGFAVQVLAVVVGLMIWDRFLRRR